jgi:hypothetical protein
VDTNTDTNTDTKTDTKTDIGNGDSPAIDRPRDEDPETPRFHVKFRAPEGDRSISIPALQPGDHHSKLSNRVRRALDKAGITHTTDLGGLTIQVRVCIGHWMGAWMSEMFLYIHVLMNDDGGDALVL